jgi:hypothetical protein
MNTIDQELRNELSESTYDQYHQQQREWIEMMKIPEQRQRCLQEFRINFLKQGIDAGASFQGMGLTRGEVKALMDAYSAAFALGAECNG